MMITDQERSHESTLIIDTPLSSINRYCIDRCLATLKRQKNTVGKSTPLKDNITPLRRLKSNYEELELPFAL